MYWKSWLCISMLALILAACGPAAAPQPPPTDVPAVPALASATPLPPTEAPSASATPSAAPTTVPATTIEGPCPEYDAQSSAEFIIAVECGLQKMDAAYLQGLMDDPVYLQSCIGGACGMFFRNYPAQGVMQELQVRLGRLGIDPHARPLVVFTVNEDDTSAFPQTPMMASSALVATSTDGGWTLYVGYDAPADRYVITDMLLDVKAGASAATLPTTTGAAATPAITPTHPDWVVYHDAVGGFSIEHPSTWKQVAGSAPPVIFDVDVPPGTTLSEEMLRISVFETAGADCMDPYGGFGEETAAPTQGTINGIAFLKESRRDQSMNQIHDWTSYSTVKGTTCISIALALNSTNMGVYSTEPAPYDPAAESALLGEMLKTFRFAP